jgi:hypothetical protein
MWRSKPELGCCVTGKKERKKERKKENKERRIKDITRLYTKI